MRVRVIIICFCFLFLGCKSVIKKKYIKKCESTILRPRVNINTYEELINYGDNLDKELKLTLLDGAIVDEFLLNKFIFDNPDYYLVDFESFLDAGTETLDGPSVRILILKSNLCGKLKIKNGEYKIEE